MSNPRVRISTLPDGRIKVNLVGIFVYYWTPDQASDIVAALISWMSKTENRAQ